MRVAVTYENGQIFQHFGHTEQFKVYNIEDNKIVNTQVVDTNGQGHGALAMFLMIEGVNVLICGGIGMGDVKLMTACGFFLGITTGAVSLVFAYILAGMFCLPLLIFKKASLKTRLPMAPFFTVSILIFLFFEERIFTWYLGLWGIL